MRNESQLTKNGVSTLDLGFLVKTVRLMASKIVAIEIKYKITPLSFGPLGLGF